MIARLGMVPRVGADPAARAQAQALLEAACDDLGIEAPEPMRDGYVHIPRDRGAVTAALHDAGDEAGASWQEFWSFE